MDASSSTTQIVPTTASLPTAGAARAAHPRVDRSFQVLLRFTSAGPKQPDVMVKGVSARDPAVVDLSSTVPGAREQPEALSRSPWPSARQILALVWTTIALLALAVLVGTLVTARGIGSDLHVERRLAVWLAVHRGYDGERVAAAVTQLGGGAVLVLVAAVATWALWRSSRQLVLLPAIALAGSQVIAQTAKRIVDRARPPVTLRAITETGYSFPSGHATAAGAVYTAVALAALTETTQRRWVRVSVAVVAIIVAIIVAATRVVLGVHWLSDVVAGLALGAAWATGAYLILQYEPSPARRRSQSERTQRSDSA
jgi:membrane-associated phospholipid phosphatase